MGAGSTEFHVLRPLGGVEPKFILYFLLQEEFRRIARSSMRGAAGQLRVPKEFMETVQIPLPPLPEQRRIVAEIETQFTRLDAAVAALERARANLKRYRAAVLEHAFTGPLVPVATVLKSPLVNGRSVPDQVGGFPVLRLTALKNGWIDLRQYKEGAWTEEQARPHTVKEDDFLVARGNGSLSLVGRGGLVRLSDQRVAFPDTMIRIRCDEEQILPRFLRLVWDAPAMRKQIEATARTTAGIHKISQRDISGFLVPVPKIDEQYRILERAEEALSVADRTQVWIADNLKRAERLRQSILRNAFAGRLAPQDPTDEPATVLLERIRAERTEASVNRSRSARQRKPGQYVLC